MHQLMGTQRGAAACMSDGLCCDRETFFIPCADESVCKNRAGREPHRDQSDSQSGFKFFMTRSPSQISTTWRIATDLTMPNHNTHQIAHRDGQFEWESIVDLRANLLKVGDVGAGF